MATAEPHFNTPAPPRLPDEVFLTLTQDEAKALHALLYSCVTGTGKVRENLDEVHTALQGAMGAAFRLVDAANRTVPGRVSTTNTYAVVARY